MKTNICPTCGCSLVRLGISKDKASTYNYKGKELYFCCKGCMELFIKDSERYIKETEDLIVCPTCLAEKPKKNATLLKIDEQDVYFCHCPHCMDLYKKDQEFYMNRLSGNTINEGVMGHDGCCIGH
jgi:YHS domain-containing protein